MHDIAIDRQDDFLALDEALARDDETAALTDDEESEQRQVTPGIDHSDFCGRECGALGPSGLLLVD